jgi:hypothetical protein
MASAIAADPKAAGAIQQKVTAPAASQVRVLRMSPPIAAPFLEVVVAPSPQTMGEPTIPVNAGGPSDMPAGRVCGHRQAANAFPLNLREKAALWPLKRCPMQ